jgi:hypothetical protein
LTLKVGHYTRECGFTEEDLATTVSESAVSTIASALTELCYRSLMESVLCTGKPEGSTPSEPSTLTLQQIRAAYAQHTDKQDRLYSLRTSYLQSVWERLLEDGVSLVPAYPITMQRERYERANATWHYGLTLMLPVARLDVPAYVLSDCSA